MTIVEQTAEEVSRTIQQLKRKRPVSQKTKNEYAILAHTLELHAQDLRRRTDVIGETRSFDPY